MVDPSVFSDVHQHIDTLSNVFSSLNLADAAETAATAAKDDNGWFGFLEGPIEFLLGLIHQGLVGVGMDADAWGSTIIAMTVIIKLVTYPLTKQQLESTNKMQVSLTSTTVKKL
jgi:YidC/Oxa1 family membrane protein insertase